VVKKASLNDGQNIAKMKDLALAYRFYHRIPDGKNKFIYACITRTHKSMNRKLTVSCIAFIISSMPFHISNADDSKAFSPYVDDKGGISLPDDFRKNMAHLGSWFVPDGEASGFHDVYTGSETIEAFRETGKFPDGSVLVKELRASKSGAYTTGKGVSHATTEIKQWFVMIKDSQNRFASDNNNWGDGWGWALYKPDDLKRNVSTNYKLDCLGCHVPARANDWVYTEAYPSLLPLKAPE
jgi:hypothetical protein